MKWFALLFTLLLCAEIFLSHDAAAWRRRRSSRRRRRWWRKAWQTVKKVAQAVLKLFGKIEVKVTCPIPANGNGCSVSPGRRKRSLLATPGINYAEGFIPQDASRLKLMTCSLAELFSKRGECAQHKRQHKNDIKAVQDVLDQSNHLLSLLKTFPATAEALRNTSCANSLPLLSACVLGYPGSLPTKLTHDLGGMETDLTPCRIDPVDVDRDLTWQECDQRGVAGLVRQDYILAYLLGDVESFNRRVFSDLESTTESTSSTISS